MRISRPLQIIPQGLLGFLQLKNGGVNPTEMPDLLQPTLELRDWMFAGEFRQIIGTVAVPNGGIGFNQYSTPMIVPSGEYWWIQSYAIHTSALVATDTCSFACAHRLVQGATNAQFAAGIPQPLITGIAATRAGCAFANDGFFLQSGGELGVRVLANESAGNITYTGQVRYTRLPI